MAISLRLAARILPIGLTCFSAMDRWVFAFPGGFGIANILGKGVDLPTGEEFCRAVFVPKDDWLAASGGLGHPYCWVDTSALFRRGPRRRRDSFERCKPRLNCNERQQVQPSGRARV